MINRNRGVFGLHIGHLWDERPQLAPLIDMLISELSAGRLTPVVARTFALDTPPTRTDSSRAEQHRQGRADDVTTVLRAHRL